MDPLRMVYVTKKEVQMQIVPSFIAHYKFEHLVTSHEGTH